MTARHPCWPNANLLRAGRLGSLRACRGRGWSACLRQTLPGGAQRRREIRETRGLLPSFLKGDRCHILTIALTVMLCMSRCCDLLLLGLLG